MILLKSFNVIIHFIIQHFIFALLLYYSSLKTAGFLFIKLCVEQPFVFEQKVGRVRARASFVHAYSNNAAYILYLTRIDLSFLFTIMSVILFLCYQLFAKLFYLSFFYLLLGCCYYLRIAVVCPILIALSSFLHACFLQKNNYVFDDLMVPNIVFCHDIVRLLYCFLGISLIFIPLIFVVLIFILHCTYYLLLPLQISNFEYLSLSHNVSIFFAIFIICYFASYAGVVIASLSLI